MELTLKLLSGRSAGKEIKVPVNKFLIGRAEDCHLRPHSDLVSRHHSVLLVEEGICAIRDFGSKNGTYVNDERIVGQRDLRTGDVVTIGALKFEVQLSSSVGGKKRPKVKDVKDVAQRTAAGPPRSGEDQDISDWLTEGEVTRDTRRVDRVEANQPPHETPALGMSAHETTFLKSPTDDTTTVQPADAGKKPNADRVEENEPVQSPRGVEAAKRLFGGKLVATQKNAAKNSHDAAADALKKLFNSRKPS